MKLLSFLCVLFLASQLHIALADKIRVPPGCYITKCVSKMWNSQCKKEEVRFCTVPCNYATRKDICCPKNVKFPETVC